MLDNEGSLLGMQYEPLMQTAMICNALQCTHKQSEGVRAFSSPVPQQHAAPHPDTQTAHRSSRCQPQLHAFATLQLQEMLPGNIWQSRPDWKCLTKPWHDYINLMHPSEYAVQRYETSFGKAACRGIWSSERPLPALPLAPVPVYRGYTKPRSLPVTCGLQVKATLMVALRASEAAYPVNLRASPPSTSPHPPRVLSDHYPPC